MPRDVSAELLGLPQSTAVSWGIDQDKVAGFVQSECKRYKAPNPRISEHCLHLVLLMKQMVKANQVSLRLSMRGAEKDLQSVLLCHLWSKK